MAYSLKYLHNLSSQLDTNCSNTSSSSSFSTRCKFGLMWTGALQQVDVIARNFWVCRLNGTLFLVPKNRPGCCRCRGCFGVVSLLTRFLLTMVEFTILELIRREPEIYDEITVSYPESAKKQTFSIKWVPLSSLGRQPTSQLRRVTDLGIRMLSRRWLRWAKSTFRVSGIEFWKDQPSYSGSGMEDEFVLLHGKILF